MSRIGDWVDRQLELDPEWTGKAIFVFCLVVGVIGGTLFSFLS